MASSDLADPFVRTIRRIWRHPANCGQRLRRLGLWIGWQAWERTVRRPWNVELRPGLSVALHPHDPVASGVLYCGLPDWPEMPFVLDYLRPGDVMVDVGANVGLYTLLAASVGGVNVIAFEPNAGARARAAANVARNGLAHQVDLRAEAVADVAGPADFTTGWGPMNRLIDGGSDAAEQVEVVTLDGAVPAPITLVKVDVEGEELAVLRGADRLLRTSRPALILEANDPEGLTAHLRGLGYSWVTYDPGTRRLNPAAPPPAGVNGIAVADPEDAGRRVGGAP
ncbi:MAG: FkbM family methyltransferase [Acidimicrobiales bacterium]